MEKVQRSNTKYSLSDIYDRKFVFQDIFTYRDRYERYDEYSHRSIYDIKEQLPNFISYLKSGGYKEVEKVFSSIGLKDASIDANPSYRGIAISQVLRTIDIYLTSEARNTIVDSFKKAKQETKELKDLLHGTRLVFSSNPWDIATMSMRGITSCMSWSHGHSRSLAGSILDPYCAIIYLTGNEEIKGSCVTYGCNMIARSVVRYVEDSKAPRLLLERVYTQNKNAPVTKVRIISEVFKEYLKNASGYQIIDSNQLNEKTFIPYWSGLESLTEERRSYRDSHIKYGQPK